MQRINCIVFGLTGLDTASIVRAIKMRKEFDKVIWFGVLPDVDINLYEAYKFNPDYDYSIKLPEEYLSFMRESLGNFLISSARRNEADFNKKTYLLSYGSTYEYLHQFMRYCYMVYELITKNQVNLIIIDSVPHTSIDIILCKAAEYFNIKTLFLYQPNIPNRFMYFSELKKQGVDFSLYYSDEHRPIKDTSRNYTVADPEKPFYMRDFSAYFYDENNLIEDLLNESGVKFIKRTQQNVVRKFVNKTPFKKAWLIFLLLRCFLNYHKNLIKLESLSSVLLKFCKYKRYENSLNQLSEKKVKLDVPYVYFPLNVQPEITTECLGDHYTDILSAVEKLRCLIPEDWKIYLKDHLLQYEFARDQIFFERLKNIPNTVLIDRFYSSFDLIKNSQFVSSVNGTAGWEAIHMGKKVLNFGMIYYEKLPGVFKYSSNLKIEDIFNSTLNKKELEIAINDLIGRMEVGVVNSDYSAMVKDFDEETNAKIVSDFICRYFFGENNLYQFGSKQKENMLHDIY